MIEKHLGETIDIHGGGRDLIFPHHENEIAQSCCAHPQGGFANFWLHNEMLQVEGKKMSKSLGNFFTVRDLLDQDVPGEVIRLVMLGTHYRKPMDWTEKKRAEAEANLRKWRALVADVTPSQPSDAALAALCDDLNTAGVLAEMHRLAQAGDGAALAATGQILGLLLPAMGDWAQGQAADLAPFAQALGAARAAAMQSKDFAEVDRLKAAFLAAGLEVRMLKDGVELLPGPNFDPDKLEGLQ